MCLQFKGNSEPNPYIILTIVKVYAHVMGNSLHKILVAIESAQELSHIVSKSQRQFNKSQIGAEVQYLLKPEAMFLLLFKVRRVNINNRFKTNTMYCHHTFDAFEYMTMVHL